MEHAAKIIEFSKAMEKYNKYFFYNKSGILVSIVIVVLQAITLINLFQSFYMVRVLDLMLVFISAYIVTDFISGLVHMYMDNNTNYTSPVGPLIAAFHLHHKTPQYKDRNPVKVYFYESGTKVWLAVYLVVLLCCQINMNLPFGINFFLVAFGILSSFAEVSHYWCHNSKKDQIIINTLQKYRILLAKQHHAYHHHSDNMNYAFLNGITNPIVNKIANCLYEGYKNNSDRHVMAYRGKQTSNRV